LNVVGTEEVLWMAQTSVTSEKSRKPDR